MVKKVFKRLPKNETVAERYNDTINNRVLITTEIQLPNRKFKLYLKTEEGYVFLKSRSNNPYFTETHPF